MGNAGAALQTVAWHDGMVRLIDQTALPERLCYLDYSDWREVADAIRTMVVRGAPAIGCTAALGVALAGRQTTAHNRDDFARQMGPIAETIRAARPTAVNLAWAVDRMLAVVRNAPGDVPGVRDALLDEALRMLDEDIASNRALGRFGATLLRDGDTVLTHCNAGALACVGYGTALGVIRAAVESGKRIRVFADETRPRLQGMKLTAWELYREGIPVTIVADNMAASLMRAGRIDCVVLGADRIAANGDVANKIGTYGVAVLASYHKVPFYVAAPLSTVDTALSEGSQIPIEERDSTEVTHVNGSRVAPEGVPVLNPAFDVTPNELVTAIVTDRGIVYPPYEGNLRQLLDSKP